jgi:cation diffusion facilitator family transporter
VIFTGSVALLADTIHNFGDAFTAVPLWIAFRLAHRKSSRRFTYGYGRVEDLAGVVIVLMILLSAIAAACESVQRLIHPQEVRFVWAVIAASIVGFVGNEAVAWFRIKVGKEIGSAALGRRLSRALTVSPAGRARRRGGVAAGFPLPTRWWAAHHRRHPAHRVGLSQIGVHAPARRG